MLLNYNLPVILRPASLRTITGIGRPNQSPLTLARSTRVLATVNLKGPNCRYYANESSSNKKGDKGDIGTNKRETWKVYVAALLGSLGGGFLVNQYQTIPRPKGSALPEYGTPEDFKVAIQELRSLLPGDTVSTDPAELHSHGLELYGYHAGSAPSVVVFPGSTEDVVKIVKVATKYRMPIVPYGAATSLEGQFHSPTFGGICVDMSNMNRITEIHAADSDLVCQAGAKWADINEALAEQGIPLFFPLDPAPNATIGGMLSTGCSGTNAVRYGTAKGEWFINATVVLPSGEVIKTRQRSRKSSAGFDTTKLFIGAEGTLGIVTEVTIRLAPVLPTAVAVVNFPDVRKATEAVIEVMNQGVGIQCVELMDDTCMAATNKHGYSTQRCKWPEKDTLFFKFQGPTEASLKETSSIVESIVKKYGGEDFQFAQDKQEEEDLWRDRKLANHTAQALKENSRPFPTDVCVPVSKLPDLVYETKKDLQESGLISPMIGHVGDGNFHALVLYSNDAELAEVKKAVHRMVKMAIALDGTCTGEHGVGMGKKQYLVEELGEGTVELMKSIKKTIDPLNLFNPGKLYPDFPDRK